MRAPAGLLVSLTWLMLLVSVYTTTTVSPQVEDYDVIIVGGGLSGLTSAYRLQNAHLKVALLEASNELGGRTRSKVYGGNSISIGGTWSILENTATLQLAAEVNAYPFVPFIWPRHAHIGKIVLYPYLFLSLWVLGAELAEHNDDYWTSPGAYELDHQNLEDWMTAQIGSDPTLGESWANNSKQAVRDWFWLIENYNGTNLSGLSALSGAVFVYKRLRLFGPEGFYTKGLFRWEGGTGVFVHAVADAITANGGKLYTSSPVTSIVYGPDGVQVTANLNGAGTPTTLHARQVIVSASLTSAAQIDYQPPLPSRYYSLFTAITRSDAAAVQVIMTWSEEWYTLAGGNAILPNAATEPLCGFYAEMFSLTPNNTSQGVLRLLVVDPVPNYDCVLKSSPNDTITPYAIEWLSQQYAVFGQPIWEYIIKTKLQRTDIWDWRDLRASIPAVTYYWPPNGTLVSWGDALRQNVSRRVYWGGSERAKNGMNWIEGAVQRGNEVACEVLQDLGSVTNCTIYQNWVRYKFHQVKANYTNMPNYESAIQTLVQKSCEKLVAEGYNCTPGAHFRTDHLNAFEQKAWAKLQAKLKAFEAKQIEEELVLHEAHKTLGEHGPIVLKHNFFDKVEDELKKIIHDEL